MLLQIQAWNICSPLPPKIGQWLKARRNAQWWGARSIPGNLDRTRFGRPEITSIPAETGGGDRGFKNTERKEGKSGWSRWGGDLVHLLQRLEEQRDANSILFCRPHAS